MKIKNEVDLAEEIRQLKPIEETYLGLGIFTALLSIVGCLLIIFSFVCFQTQRTVARKILVYISFCNLLKCIGTLLSAGLVIRFHQADWFTHPICESAGTISIIGNISSYLWSSLLAVHLYIALNWKQSSMAKAVMVPAHIICWGFPVAIVIAALISEAVGADNGQTVKQQQSFMVEGQLRPPWCLVSNIIEDYATWSFLTGYGWRMAAVILCTASYLLIQLAVIRKIIPPVQEDEDEPGEPDESEVERRKELFVSKSNRKIRHVLIIFILINVWGVWRFLIGFYVLGPHGIVAMQVIGDNIQGFANAILLCVFNKDMRQKLRKAMQNCCRCKKLQETDLKFPVEIDQLLEQDQDHRNLLMNIANNGEEDPNNEEETHFSRV